jgi:hypothetical protein
MTTARLRFRWAFVVVEALLAFAGLSGAIQLLSGSFTPPVEDLRPLGLDSWILPGLWLLVVVAIPAAVATALAARRALALGGSCLPAVPSRTLGSGAVHRGAMSGCPQDPIGGCRAAGPRVAVPSS